MPFRIERKFVILGAIAVLLLGGAAAVTMWVQRSSVSTLLRPGDAKLIALGAAIYGKECASCHGKALKGQPDWRTRLPNGRMPAPPHDETGHTWHHADKLLFDLTKKGPAALIGGNYKSDMLGYAGMLTDDEIVAVLSYIKSTWPRSVQERHDTLNRRQP